MSLSTRTMPPKTKGMLVDPHMDDVDDESESHSSESKESGSAGVTERKQKPCTISATPQKVGNAKRPVQVQSTEMEIDKIEKTPRLPKPRGTDAEIVEGEQQEPPEPGRAKGTKRKREERDPNVEIQ